MILEAWLAAVCLFGASLYLGLGYSLVILQFPGALSSTHAANFPERFGDPVRRAVAIFTVLSIVMAVAGVWLTVLEWDDGVARRWLPLVFTVMLVAATAFTQIMIVPVNHQLYQELEDEHRFTSLLTRWVRLNVIRYALWIVEWLGITGWFVAVVSGASA